MKNGLCEFSSLELLKEIEKRLVVKEMIDESPHANESIPMEDPETFARVAAPHQTPTGYPIVCDDCKTPSRVPFKPNPNRPVLCKTCYYARRI